MIFYEIRQSNIRQGYECRSLNYSDHINDYKEKLSIYDTGVGIFTENGYAFQKLRWHLLGASFEVLIVPCQNTPDAFEFGAAAISITEN